MNEGLSGNKVFIVSSRRTHHHRDGPCCERPVYLLSDVVLVDGVLKGKVKFAARQGWIVVIIIQEPCISPSEQSHLYVFAEFSVKKRSLRQHQLRDRCYLQSSTPVCPFGNHKILIRFSWSSSASVQEYQHPVCS